MTSSCHGSASCEPASAANLALSWSVAAIIPVLGLQTCLQNSADVPRSWPGGVSAKTPDLWHSLFFQPCPSLTHPQPYQCTSIVTHSTRSYSTPGLLLPISERHCKSHSLCEGSVMCRVPLGAGERCSNPHPPDLTPLNPGLLMHKANAEVLPCTTYPERFALIFPGLLRLHDYFQCARSVGVSSARLHELRITSPTPNVEGPLCSRLCPGSKTRL